MKRILCWFSCGAASAVASKIALTEFSEDEVLPVYCDTSRNEHPDNQRFFYDCEKWFGVPILCLKNDKFSTVEEVFAKYRYMSGISGAPCTGQLKKVPRYKFAKPDDYHVFGFTANEEKRIIDFELRNPELKTIWILRDNNVSKEDCYRRLSEAHIELPTMYKLGYRNNNCIGCVKATSPGYWNKIRRDFPIEFMKRAEQSREIGCRLTRVKGKRIFLDELPESNFQYEFENISCGPECGVAL